LIKAAREKRPALAILVDFPDFNLRLARRLSGFGIPVCYFIGPQMWAWRQSRVKQIRRNIDLMLVIFPFEEEFYTRHGVEAVYVGNPTASRLNQSERRRGKANNKPPVVALLPGSRKKEVELLLPVLLDTAHYLGERLEIQLWLQKAPGIESHVLQQVQERWEKERGSRVDLEIRDEGSLDVLGKADCAVVKSGTSTLEALLLEVPFAMVYKLPFFSWLILKPFVRIGTYCLANLVAGRRVVPEFVQQEALGSKIGEYLEMLLKDAGKRLSVETQLRDAREKLGSGDAYVEGARQIVGKFF
jgi:lipid-A-disaccharide synthase